MSEAHKTPLVDLLRGIPEKHRTEWPIQFREDGTPTGHTMCPVGRFAHEAADKIDELQARVAMLESLVEDGISDPTGFDTEWDISAKQALESSSGGAWLLRQKAEAVERAIDACPEWHNRTYLKIDEVSEYAKHLRLAADKAEKGGCDD